MDSDLLKLEEGIGSANKSGRAFSFDFDTNERLALASKLGLKCKIE